jgi:WD40 repeat protein/serine/threonine protein kinase
MSTSSADRNPVEKLAEEFAERHRRGERPAMTEYTDRYPQWADEIRELFPAMLVMEQLKPAAADPTGEYHAATDDTVLERLGEYRILREVGRGGMGIVYEAVQESLGRHVALKVLPAQSLLASTQLERFRREAKAAAQLHHTNIVPVFGVGEWRAAYSSPPVHYYAMQFIRGEGLDKVLADVRRLRRQAGEPVPATAQAEASVAHSLLTGQFAAPQPDAPKEPAAPPAAGSMSGLSASGPEAGYCACVARIGVQVAEALAYAHRQGILHRDIKPSNLLLDAQGMVWVTDFGLAKAEGTGELTHTGDIVGTIRFMAPERFEGKSLPQSDVYALGLTLYELLTLRPAFDDTRKAKLIDTVLHEPPTAPRKLDGRIPRDLETIVLKCLAKEPRQRYATAEAMAEDLQCFLADRPISARRATAAERLWRWCRRNPAKAAAASLAVVTLMAVVALAIGSVFLVQLRHEQERTEAARQEAENYRHEAEHLSANLALERGLTLAGQGEVAQGMLWVARGLKVAREDDADLQRDLRMSLAVWQRQLHPLRAVFEHPDMVQCVKLSRDGKLLVTGCMDGAARLWDAVTGQQVGPNLKHQDNSECRPFCFSSDDKILATGGADGFVRLWDTATGRQLPQAIEHKDVIEVAFRPDGHTILTVSSVTAQLWELAAGKPVSPPISLSGKVDAAVANPDGQTFFTASRDGSVRKWEVATGKQLRKMPFKLQGGVSALAISPDGKVILTESAEGVHQWDTATGKQRGTTLPPPSFAHGAASAFNGRTILIRTDDTTAARVWDAHTGQPLGTTLRHRNGILGFAFSGDGKLIATGSYDYTARVWERSTVKPFAHVFHLQGPGNAVAFSPDGKTIATATTHGIVQLWDVASKKPIGPQHQHQSGVDCLKYSADSRIVVAADHNGIVRVLEVATGMPIGSPLRHGGPIWSDCVIAISPDSKIIVTGSRDGTARLWKAATAEPIGPPLKHKDQVWSVAISPNGKTIATGSKDGGLRFWDVATAKQIGPPLECGGTIARVAFSPDGQTVLTGGEDGTARIRDLATGELRFPPLKASHDWLILATFSPDGHTILTGDANGITQVWNAVTGERLGKPFPGSQCSSCVAWSADSKTVVTGTNEAVVRLWDAATGKSACPRFMRHQGVITAVAFSPDGKYVLSGGVDKTVRLWELPTPVPGYADRISLWVAVLTGMELDENDVFHVLDAADWQVRRQRLEELGGAPMP